MYAVARLRGQADLAPYSVALLAISVGQPYHEGKKLRAAVELVDKRFLRCVVDVSDTLQRHNLIAGGMPEAEAFAEALHRGDTWLARNGEILAGIEVPTEIKRWESWRACAGEVTGDFQRLFDADAEFRGSVEEDARTFVSRRERYADPAALFQSSIAFIVEECGVMTVQSRQQPHAKIYPAHEMPTLARLRRQEFKHAPQGLEKSIYCRCTIERRAAAG